MKMVEVKIAKDQEAAKAKKHMVVKMRMGENIEELTKLFTPEVVYQHACASIVISAQSGGRLQLNKEKDPVKTVEGLQKWMDAYKPGKRAVGVSRVNKAKSLLDKLSPEERDELFKAHAGKKGK